ncbi:MAG: hypothetical protein PUJ51_20740 [Clostridiales bacterium]|nr:hypothetical protein [Clostridiales bacterium]
MRSSRGEIKIEEILKENGIPFKEEYSFPDLVTNSGRPLRFDFAIFDDEGQLEFLIEYQGIQHYEAKSKFGGYAGLRKQQYNDMQKRIYCKKNNIILIAIPYTDEGRITYDYIMKAYYAQGGF